MEERGFTSIVAVCFTLNNIIGTGFLVLPWAFVQAGVVLSVVTLVVCTIICDMTVVHELEAMARAEALLESQEDCHTTTSYSSSEEERRPMVEKELQNQNAVIVTKQTDSDNATRGIRPDIPIIYMENGGYQSILPSSVMLQINDKPLQMKERKFANNSLCEIFFGKLGLLSYTFFISVYLFLMNWIYASVFGLSVARVAPLPLPKSDLYSYCVYVLIFAAIVMPLSMRDLEDQKLVQVTLTVCRILRLAIMIVTAALWSTASFGLSKNTHVAEEEDAGGPYGLALSEGDANDLLAATATAYTVPMVRWNGFFKMLPIVAVAGCCHMSIPDLAHPIKDKSRAGCVFHWSLIIATIIYGAIGAAAGLRFGNQVDEAANLNWSTFRDPNNGIMQWLYIVISYFVVISPALDVISAFPILAITLGNNIAEIMLGDSVRYSERVRNVERVSRLIAAVPPIIGALFIRDLGIVTRYAGVACMSIMFAFPPILFILSGRSLRSKGIRADTHYRTFGSNEVMAFFILFFGVAMMGIALTLLLLGK